MASTSNTEKEYEALKEEMAALRNELAAVTARLKDLGLAAVDEATAGGRAKLREMRDDLGAAAGELQERGRAQLDTWEQKVREQPLLSVLAAFGIGFVLARLAGRR
jgi:ElaB/YqjD/DUF883 family membrane-anchored ribosome-binding protein